MQRRHNLFENNCLSFRRTSFAKFFTDFLKQEAPKIILQKSCHDNFLTGLIIAVKRRFVNIFQTELHFPPLPQHFQLGVVGEGLSAGFPIDGPDFGVADFEGVLLEDGVDDLFGSLLFAQGHIHPHIFQHVGKLAEEVANTLQPFGEQIMHPVFHRVAIAHVIDEDGVVDLPDALDASLALFQAGGDSTEGRD